MLLTSANRTWVMVLCTMLGASAAHAQATTDDPARREEAKARYAQGAAAYRAGQFDEAVELFLTADRLAPSPALSFNVARAYEKLEQPARALEHYRAYLRRGAEPRHETAVRARVSELEGVLKARGVQQLSVLSEPSGAHVLVDGRPAGTTPWTEELAPGEHVVRITKDGFAEERRDVELDATRALDVTVVLAPAAPSAGALPPTTNVPLEPVEESGTFRPGPWVTMGLGGAALVGAGVFELLRSSAADAAKDTPQTRFADYEDRYDRAQSHQTTARVLAVSGGVLVLAGGVWAYIEHRNREETRARAKQTTQAALGCDARSCYGSLGVSF
jgi:tetratricopeptide (TPR) repeat protein